MNFLGSRNGKILICVMVGLAIIGGVRWKVSSLEREIDRLQVKNANEQIRNKLCQADLGALMVSVEDQNRKVAELEQVNRAMTIASAESAREELTGPVEVDRVVMEGTGPVVLNKFMNDIFGE